MSLLITLDKISLSYGVDNLLDEAELQVNSGERACLLGRNGAGKSTLLKIIAGMVEADEGSIWRKPELRVAYLAQDLPDDVSLTVFEYVAQGLAGLGELLTSYHQLTISLANNSADQDLRKLEKLQHEIDHQDGWQYEQKITSTLSQLEIDADATLSSLSGGWQRRAALARALVISPELLLLDEPTNHLDIEAIKWLEEFLLKSQISLVFITHDRALVKSLATCIIELDRGQLTSWPGDYQQFLKHKEEALHAEARHHAEFDKKLAQEEKWIRQGIKARRTRNEGRVRSLIAMRNERAQRRERQGSVNLNVTESLKSGRMVVEAEHISHYFNEHPVVKDFSIRIMRGDRIGLIGPNGIGKSTLLNIFLGKLKPSEGHVELGSNLQIAYFDQRRAALDPEKTVAENVAEGSDTVEVDGKRKHIISYLGDFLFSPQRVRTPVKALSGGECNRLLLAKLFTKPANLLVLDEPTNDLDIETLELLEEMLCNYQGTLLLVSHDREFLDNVVTSTLLFEGNGKVQEYVGGYTDCLRQSRLGSDAKNKETNKVNEKKDKPKSTSKKLSYKNQRELEQLPKRIESLEEEIVRLQSEMAMPDFFQRDNKEVTAAMQQLADLNQQLEAAYQRWEELEAD